MVGRTVLQYQFRERLGAGGMGEVYKALDTRLNRFVAIKVLPDGMSADPENRRRFIQEGQAASALNHPNIMTIYDVVHEGDTQYMVMEYVAGDTLLELIAKDGLAIPETIQYASQMADALSAAHRAGIIHRDLKPANVMVTSSGLVKLLDFGLAKLMDWSPGAGIANTSTLHHSPLTVAGAIMGAVSYMSPEQASGGKLDARSDIFSFGAVLYEMVTGRCAFRGNSAISTLSAVLRDEVEPMAELTPTVPFDLEQIVLRCLKRIPPNAFSRCRS
jgi:serine/threonine protein kinase